MSGIFISYRRADSQGFAGRLGDDLEDRYGARHVFRDVEIEPGTDFSQRITRAVTQCDVLVVVIGPLWSGITDPAGQRRLWNSDDWVRLEIEAGLERNVPLLPVLVGGAAMPAESDVPPSLVPLLRVQALEMTDRQWNADLEQLCAFIDRRRPGLRVKPQARSDHRPARPSRWPARLRAMGHGTWWLTKKAAMVGFAVALGYYLLENHADSAVKQFVYGFVRFLRQTLAAIVA